MRVLVRDDLKDTDGDITKYGDGSVFLCTDDYHIYNGIKEHVGVDAHLAVTHDDTYVIGDAHTNSSIMPAPTVNPYLGHSLPIHGRTPTVSYRIAKGRDQPEHSLARDSFSPPIVLVTSPYYERTRQVTFHLIKCL